MRKILIPFDGSEAALHALEYTVSLKDSLSEIFQCVELCVLNVQADVHLFGEYVTPIMLNDMRKELLDHADHINQQAIKYLSDHGIASQSLGRVGDAADQIVDVARELECDSILMGTRGMGNFGNLLLGSVATKVIHETDLPVTLIKPTTSIK